DDRRRRQCDGRFGAEAKCQTQESLHRSASARTPTGGTANETAVDLYNCNNTGAQVFIPQSDKCLDNTNWSAIREPRCRSGPAQATPARTESAVTRHGTARACS